MGALRERNFRMDARIKSGHEGETPTDAMNILPWLTATAAPGAPGAHLSAFHRGSRPKESFIARDSAPGFLFLGLGGQFGCPSSGRYPLLPVPVQRIFIAA